MPTRKRTSSAIGTRRAGTQRVRRATDAVPAAVTRATEAYLDELFGPGMGRRHTRFLAHIESDALRATVHRFHALEADTRWLSHEENYLLGMCVLCATRSYATAGMFAKTLRHLGTPRARILDAVARLAMWTGGIAAAEASAHIQRALDEFDAHGLRSMAAWFPDEPPRAKR
jgi:hypothetical protein